MLTRIVRAAGLGVVTLALTFMVGVNSLGDAPQRSRWLLQAAAMAVPLGWLNWLVARLYLQRAGWRVPLRSERFGVQCIVCGSAVLSTFITAVLASGLLGLVAGRQHELVIALGLLWLPPVALHRFLAEREPFLRGRVVRPRYEAELEAEWLRAEADPGLPWGGLMLATPTAALHYALVGRTGSGKSLLMWLHKLAVLPKVGTAGVRALVYDEKRDVVARLLGVCLRGVVKILHPFDLRGVAWHIAADCKAIATALQLAETLIPKKDEGPNSYFTDAARDLLAGIIISLMRAAGDEWTLRDVLLIARDRGLLVRVLSRCEETRGRLEHLREERTAQSVISTLLVNLAPFEPIAAAWEHAAERVSLEQWVAGQMVLVLGTDAAARGPVDAINRAMFRRVVDLVQARKEQPGPDTFIYLDEVREAGRLDGLGSLLTKGRSKGAAVVLGFQDIEGLRAVYGDREANELVGQCAHKALLGLESPATAEWASAVVGDAEREEVKTSTGANGLTFSYERVRREGVLPSEFQSLPSANPADGVTGFFVAPGIGAYRGDVRAADLAPVLNAPALGENFVPRPAWQQMLRAWSDADSIRIGLPTAATPSEPPPPAAPAGDPEAKSALRVVGQVLQPVV